MRLRAIVCVPGAILSLFAAAYLAAQSLGVPAAADRDESGMQTGQTGIPALSAEPMPSADPAQAVAPALTGDPAKEPNLLAVDPGDCLWLTGDSAARAGFCVLYDRNGRRIARADFFPCPDAPSALLAIPATTETDTYRLETTERFANGAVTASFAAVRVKPKAFAKEEIPLDESNTAIRTDKSKERVRQIDRLNGILYRVDPAAPRYFGPWTAPAGEARRSSGFSDRRTYRYADGTRVTAYHYGIDFALPRGTPVFAAGDGRVALAENRISTGWSVVIEHLPGVYSLYYHLDKLATAEGELVRAGTLIGQSGSTGLSTGPHLHWEFRVNGEAVSPDWFLFTSNTEK